MPAAVIVLAAGVVTALVVSQRDPIELGPREMRLLPSGAGGVEPFGESAAHPVPETGVPLPPAPSGRRVAGDAPGLYAGVRGVPRCSPDAVSASFAAHAMAAWAAAQSIDPDEVDGYLDSMFPVILRRDTLVTSHRFDGTDAIAESAVLQRGTPVLVDDRGVPRLRCPGLQPLRPPADASSGGTYRGSAWFGFRAAGVVRVRPARAPLDGLRVVDPTTGEPFVRGRAGLVDRDA